MAPKTEKKRNRTFVIIGLGTVGSTVATDLARSGNHVLGIDINEKSVAARPPMIFVKSGESEVGSASRVP